MNTVDRARGRWKEILPRFGIDTSYLKNRHGPCPLCGGKDRFRFDDKDGSGSYICNQCGAGVGLILVRKLHDWDFKRACDEVDRIIGIEPTIGASPRVPQKPNEKRATEAIRRALAQAVDSQVVETYLTRRGISARSFALRGHARCPYHNIDGRLVGYLPTVIAPILGPNCELQSAHRIYDADVIPRKKTMPPVTTISGGP